MNANLLVMKKGNFPFFSTRKTSRENFRLSFTETYVLALGLIAILGIYYVFMLNVNATKGYEVRNLELTRKNLVFEQNLVNIRIAEAESLSTISDNPSVQKMNVIDSPKYLVLKDSFLTLKK
jgi:hypothetical protein